MEENRSEERNKNGTDDKLKKIIMIISVTFALVTVVSIVVVSLFVYSVNKAEDQVREKDIDGVRVNSKYVAPRVIKHDISDGRVLPTDEQVTNDIDTDIIQEVHDVKIERTYVDWVEKLQEAPDTSVCNGADQCYVSGKIIRGDQRFIGKNMYLVAQPTLGGMDFIHFVIYEENGNQYKFIFTEDNSPIAGINDVPETLTIDDFDTTFKRREWVTYLYKDISNIDDHKVTRHDTLGKIYRAEEDCLIAELPDHTAQMYEYNIPFMADETRKPRITFYDGVENDSVYEYKVHSCSNLCLKYVHNEKVTSDMLNDVGTTSNGDPIYAFKNDHDPVLEALYNNKNTVAYFGDNWSDKLDQNKYSYEEYISMYPYLYWKNPFGQYIEFVNEKFIIAAEMCKPVVYFYSKDEKNIHFDVNPIGGFTHTEPQHNDGWDLRTIGNGRIRDQHTGKEYDSLLWEGMALGYNVPEEGWVVAINDLDEFFDEKLRVLGMNNKEIEDFKEYWIARLNDFPYYRLSFMDREQFDYLAPLSFSQSPDNIIRVMMIAKGEQNYYDLQEQNLITNTSRQGFTIVEWGGMLE